MKTINKISGMAGKLFTYLKSMITFKKGRLCIGDKCSFITQKSKRVKTIIQQELNKNQIVLEIMKENQPFWI